MTKSLKELQLELDDIVDWFDGELVDVDEAITKYKHAQELIKQMKQKLSEAKNEIKKIHQEQ
jgi:exodeoxyribonuclease VII small subunit